MKENHNRICCMFSDLVPGHAVDNCDLRPLAIDEWSRKEYRICRCEKCGAYVLYEYEETASYGGWDNAVIDEAYYPIEDPTVDGKLDAYPEAVTIIKGAHYLYTRYAEEDWAKDRNWWFNET